MVRIRAFWRGFKDIAIIISFITNFVLIVVLLFVVLLLFQIKSFVQDSLINGLYTSFVGLDQAHIVTTINVNDPAIPVKLNIPLQQNTTVTLTKDVQISGARTAFTLSDGTTLHGAVTITLPANTQLPVALDLSVPVDSSIPINLKVPVDIALDQTQLHDPFANLREVLRPYVRLLGNLPNSWGDFWVFGGKLIGGAHVDLNGETTYSNNPWPGFCTGLPTPRPGAPIPTLIPGCIPASGASNQPNPGQSSAPSGGSSGPGIIPGNPTQPPTPGITPTPTHVNDAGIITASPH